MADVGQILSDPNFQALPLPEKNKVLLRVDPNFRGLPAQERMKALSVIQYHKPLPSVPKSGLKEDIKQAAYGAALPLAGLGQAVLDVPQFVRQVATAAFAPPQSPEEDAVSSVPGGLLASRLVVQPMQEEAQKARESKGAERVAHAVASGIPVVGPMVAGIGESIQKPEDVPFTLGRALGWEELPEFGGKALKAIPGRKPPLPEPAVVNEVMGRVVKDQLEAADRNLHAEVSKHADHVAQTVDDPARNPQGAIEAKPILGKLEELWNRYIKTYTPVPGSTPPAVFQSLMDEALNTPTGRWTFEQAKQLRTAVNEMVGKTKDSRIKAIGKQLSDKMRDDMRTAASNAGVGKDFDTYNKLHQQQQRIRDQVLDRVKDSISGEDVMRALHSNIGYVELTLPSLEPYGAESKAIIDAAKVSGKSKLTSKVWKGWAVRHAAAELAKAAFGAPYMVGYFGGGVAGEALAGGLSKEARALAQSPQYGRGMQLVRESLPGVPTDLSEPAPLPPPPPPKAPRVLPPLPELPKGEITVEATPVTEAAKEMPPSKYQAIFQNLEQMRMLNAAIRKLGASSKKGLTEQEVEWIGQQTGVDMTKPGAIGKARKALIEKRNQIRSASK